MGFAGKVSFFAKMPTFSFSLKWTSPFFVHIISCEYFYNDDDDDEKGNDHQ